MQLPTRQAPGTLHGASVTKTQCKVIEDADLQSVAELLAQGFSGRKAADWLAGLRRQGARDVPAGWPRYGYRLDAAGRTVGVLLVLYTARDIEGETVLRCSLSSWYVDPDFRSHATLLTSVAQKLRTTSYVNLTAAPHTWPIIEAQGFKCAGTGTFFSFPLVSGGASARVAVLGSDPVPGLSEAEHDLLRRHATLGCRSLVCRTGEGALPFILAPFRVRRGRLTLPGMRLIYARDLDSYRLCARALGAFLAVRGRAFVALSADGPVPGLRGIFTTQRGRRYVRGPHPPSPYDLTDSEFVVFQV